eukprot:1774857-Amphidinium_carterae.1
MLSPLHMTLFNTFWHQEHAMARCRTVQQAVLQASRDMDFEKTTLEVITGEDDILSAFLFVKQRHPRNQYSAACRTYFCHMLFRLKSLLNAGFMSHQCILREDLKQGSEHVPFRDSKLTRLLSINLGGNSQTGVLITLAPPELSLCSATCVHSIEGVRGAELVHPALRTESSACPLCCQTCLPEQGLWKLYVHPLSQDYNCVFACVRLRTQDNCEVNRARLCSDLSVSHFRYQCSSETMHRRSEAI